MLGGRGREPGQGLPVVLGGGDRGTGLVDPCVAAAGDGCHLKLCASVAAPGVQDAALDDQSFLRQE